MAYDNHVNFGVSIIATAPSPATSGTSLVVTAGQGTRFPTPPFNATIWPAGQNPDPANAEIVRVTGVSTDTLTITRAQESSSARTVVVGDYIAATVTKKTITDLEAQTPYLADSQSGTGASGVLTLTVPAGYSEAELSIYGRSDTAATSVNVQMTCESSPTAGAYDHGYIIQTTATATGVENNGASNFILVGVLPGASSTANLYGSIGVWLPDYANTGGWKSCRFLSAGIGTLTSGSFNPSFGGGAFEQTAAITTIKLTLSTGNWTTASRARLRMYP